jgi:hypothetical protein
MALIIDDYVDDLTQFNLPEYFEEDINITTDIISLNGCPKHLKGKLIIQFAPSLTSLNGAPEIIEGDLFIHSCGIDSFYDSTIKEIHGGCYIINNELTSLKNIPLIKGINVSFAKNKIEYLDFDPNKLPNVEFIDLSSNPLRSFEPLHKLKSLNHVTAEQTLIKNLKYLPHKLKELNVSNSSLTTLKGSLYEVDILKAQSCQINSLKHCPIINESLFLQFNNIKSLNNIKGKPNHINLSNNQIKKFKHISYVKSLNLNHNQLKKLSYIPKGIIGLTATHNQIKSINLKFDKMEHLDLRYNNITDIKIEANEIKHLNLAFNNISTLKHIKAKISNLTTSNNNITDFDNLPNVENVWFNIHSNSEYNKKIIDILIDKQKLYNFLLLPQIKKLNIDFNIIVNNKLSELINLNDLVLDLKPELRKNLLIKKELYYDLKE